MEALFTENFRSGRNKKRENKMSSRILAIAIFGKRRNKNVTTINQENKENEQYPIIGKNHGKDLKFKQNQTAMIMEDLMEKWDFFSMLIKKL